MQKEEPVRRFIQKTPGARFEPANGPATLSGLALEIGANGLPTRIAPVRVGGRLEETRPGWWDA
jgi:calcineurin-like phosphoesterase